MKWDLSDVDQVPSGHAGWFNTWVLPIMLRSQGLAEVVQDIAVRVWVHGPDFAGEVNMPADWHWEREAKVVHQRSKPRSQKRERFYDDTSWQYAWEEAERYGTLVEDGGMDGWRVGDMLSDAAPAQRGFLFHWAVQGLTVEEAARTVGVSRATGYRWRDELKQILQMKWSGDDGDFDAG